MLVIVRPDLYEYTALPMTDDLFWRRIENLKIDEEVSMKKSDTLNVEPINLNFKVNRNPILPLIAIGMWANWKITFLIVFLIILFLES